MKKTLALLFTCMSIMSLSLTSDVVVATANQEVVVKCDACTSGSPLLESYYQLMNKILGLLESTPSQNPGAVPGQRNNIDTKKTQSNIWAQRSNDSSLTITNQSNGIKSDMIALNKINDRIISAGVGLINTKFVRKQQISPNIRTSIQQLLNAQIGNAGLFISGGVIDPLITYEKLMEQLMMLHNEVSDLTEKQPTKSFLRLGYRSNPLIINKITIYYECAHKVPTCRSQTTTINNTASSVKKYRSQILRAGQQIEFALSKEYWDTGENINNNFFTKEGRKNLMSRIKVNINGRSVSNQYSQIIGKARDTNSEIFKQKSREKEQAQNDEKDNIIAIKNAINQGVQLTVPASSSRIITTEQPSYNLRAMDTLVAGLNAQSDRIITKLLNDQQASLKADTRDIAFDIPKAVSEIYLAGLKVNDASNMAKNKCDEHCSNINNGSCGASVAS